MATEKRLIDANALISQFDDCNFKGFVLKRLIELQPTVDAVEVVRCKDCQHWKNSWSSPEIKEAYGYCHLEDADNVIVGRWETDFCSYGERRTEASNG